MNNFKRNIYRTENEAIAIPTTESALRSSLGYATTIETDICLQTLPDMYKIDTQTANQITSGDIVYEIDGTTIFNGNGLYYNVALSVWTGFEGTRVCLINTNGTINVDTICV